MQLITNILIQVISILAALTFHEAAHGFVANKLGDPTAKNAGRVTLNPIKHLDPLGTILFVIAGIGWGKPVPVNPANFKNPVRDNALTALAGPASNVILALLAIITFKVLYLANIVPSQLTIEFLSFFLQINVVLCFFNLIPLPPLDGSKIIMPLIPKAYRYQYFKFANQSLTYVLAFFLFDGFIINRFFGFSLISTYLNKSYEFFIITTELILPF